MGTHSLSDPRKWVELYGDYLYRYTLRQINNQQTAEDIVQEALLAALSAQSSFSGKSTEKTWLTGILKYKIIDHIRKKYREKSFGIDAQQADETAADSFFDSTDHWQNAPKTWCNPQAALEEKEFMNRLHQCIHSLPDRVGQAFSARMVDQTPYEDLCKILNISSTHLGVILHRARLQMRQCLEQNWFQRDTKT